MSRPQGLTEQHISKLRPARTPSRYDVPVGETPNLFVRVGAPQTMFVLLARFGCRKNSSRRAIGVFGVMSPERVRAIATSPVVRDVTRRLSEWPQPTHSKTKTDLIKCEQCL